MVKALNFQSLSPWFEPYSAYFGMGKLVVVVLLLGLTFSSAHIQATNN